MCYCVALLWLAVQIGWPGCCVVRLRRWWGATMRLMLEKTKERPPGRAVEDNAGLGSWRMRKASARWVAGGVVVLCLLWLTPTVFHSPIRVLRYALGARVAMEPVGRVTHSSDGRLFRVVSLVNLSGRWVKILGCNRCSCLEVAGLPIELPPFSTSAIVFSGDAEILRPRQEKGVAQRIRLFTSHADALEVQAELEF